MTTPSDAPIISVEHVTKEYHLRQERSNIRGLIPGPRGELMSASMFSALDDLSFEVTAGEALGVIGHNGAGKSTLLKMLAGIIEPTRGSVQVNGRVSALIELGAAFEPALTGEENVYFAAGLMGLSVSETRTKFAEIVEFSGVGEFLDMPVRRYSTGMRARLGFAVASCVQPDILIVDEVLSVGDFAFQQRSFERIRDIHANGATLVLVSHSSWMVTQMCDRLILLSEGALVMDGPPADVMAAYLGPDHVAEPDPTIDAPRFVPFEVIDGGPPAVTIDEMWTTPETISPNDPIDVSARINVHRPTEGIVVLSFFTGDRAVFAERDPGPSEFLLTPGEWVVTARIPRIPIATGSFLFRFAVLPEDSNDPAQQFETALATAQVAFTITGPVTARPGLALETDWVAEPYTATAPTTEPPGDQPFPRRSASGS